MKMFLTGLIAALTCALQAADVQTLSSQFAPRISTATGLIDIWQVNTKACRLLSLYGFNASTQQFVHIFDSTNGPTVSVNGFDQANDWFTNASGSVGVGDVLRLTNTYAGLSAGLYYALPVATNRFMVCAARSTAIASDTLNAQDLTGGSSGGTFMRMPVHSFIINGNDNFSCVVPVTGIEFGRGLCIATSTTGALYTPGGTNITACLTIGPP